MSNFQNRRVLITGANGFVGAHLVAQLIAQGAEVTALIRASSNCWRFDALKVAPKILVCDLEDEARLLTLLRPLNPDVVFHLATERDSQKLAAADVQGVSAFKGDNVMQAVARSKTLTKFISVGSAAEIPDPLTGHPRGLHGKSKARELLALSALGQELNMPYAPTRTHYVYGPLQSPGKLVPVAIDAARSGHPLSLTGADIRKRYVYVLDLVEALLQVVDLPTPARDVHLITGAEQVSNIEVVKQVAKLFGKPIKIRGNDYPPRVFDRSDWSLSQAGTPLTGWHAKTPLVDGLQACISWEAEAHV